MDKQKRKEFNKKAWWGPVDSKELAEFIVKEVAKAFYVVAAIEVVIGIIVFWPGLILQAALLAVIAYWLQKSKSQIPAVILLILSVLSVIGTVMSITGGAVGGTNIVLSILMLWLSIRAFLATKKISEGKSTPGPSMS